MTTTPPDPLATQHGSTPDPGRRAPDDEQARLLEENRALRELLASQVHAGRISSEPGLLRRLGWWLISAPGAMLVGWRSLLNRGGGRPITGKRVGYATLTVLYTLAIYGALVLLVVYWSSPNTVRSGATAAGPVRLPLGPLPTLEAEPLPAPESAPSVAPPAPETMPEPQAEAQLEPAPAEPAAAPAPRRAAAEPAPLHAHAAPAPTAPQSTLRITEIPATNPLAWQDALKGALASCAERSFLERPDCAWAAREQYCEPHRAWGTVKECPTRP